jgi:lipopolysaccharide transport system ATP-binding protein
MPALRLTQVTKQFRRRTVGTNHTTVKAEVVRWLLRRPRPSVLGANIDVLKGIDLEIAQGETFGIIGRNGSGKSTLLKLMTGIYTPTSGKIEVNGRVSALLELGAGFHPDFSGRENIFVNGIILGMSRAQIRDRMEAIVGFSEIADFIDEPVRTYSSGMFMRLAFAVATHVDPDILVVDEILAVGDDHFARKSMAKMTEFKERGKTIVLVTHDLGTVQRWCDRAAWIDEGRVAAIGAPGDVVATYRRSVAEAEYQGIAPLERAASAPEGVKEAVEERSSPALPRPVSGPRVEPDRRWGDFRVEISAVRLLNALGREQSVFDTEEGMSVELDWFAKEYIRDAVFGVSIEHVGGVQVYGTNTIADGIRVPLPLAERGTLCLEIQRLGLLNGDYFLDVAAHSRNNVNYDYQRHLYRFSVRSAITDVGLSRPPHAWTWRLAEQYSGANP